MSYTPEQVDKLIVQLEKNVQRQLDTVNSAVKGVAAERDLLSTAEAARDLLLKAVKGEKDYLDQVFGGSCERIGRLRRCLDPPQFSDMHKKDPRWQNLRAVIETVEAVLRDLGTFKPWEPPELEAPKKVSYSLRRRISPGRDLRIKPELEGGEVNSFQVSPNLPEGLELDSATGIISGTLPLGKLVDEATYRVTAKNDSGEAQAELTFSVKETPPVGLSYPNAQSCITVNQVISWAPSTDCGDSSSWAVSPDLPAGLVLDPTSGRLTGAATEISPEKTYEISASNSGGKAMAVMTLEVRPGRPKSPAYHVEGSLVLFVGEETDMMPEDSNNPDITFSISPSLPPGLSFDEATGRIYGTPTEAQATTDFEVTANNYCGSESVSFPITVRPEKPHNLRYPSMHSCYVLGDEPLILPEVDGTVKEYSVAPALPEGLLFDATTGGISGTCTSVCDEAFVITALGEDGETSTEVKLTVVLPAPANFSYPMASFSYAVGEPMTIEPELEGPGCSFSVEPALPEGVSLDASTGLISGTPAGESPETTYTVTATNESGSIDTTFTFQVEETQTVDAEAIDQNFAAKLEEIDDLADLNAVEEPSKVKSFGDWMIWMVHRAHLNDPTLTDFNFNNLHMPPPHMEERIAPKLVKAMAHNTHITTLSLVNSNLHKGEGCLLAESLKSNNTVLHVNLENNCLDSAAVRNIAECIAQNSDSKLESLRVAQQKQVGNSFGRPVEEAFGQLLEKNERLLRLGFVCSDAHWRNLIDRALLRNNDFARRRRKKMQGGEEDEVQAEEKSLSRLVLLTPPQKPLSEMSGSQEPSQRAVQGFVAAHRKFPTPTQLQAYGKSNGMPLKYSELSPALQEFLASVLDAARGTEVTVADAFEVDTSGTMKSWSIKNSNWSLDIWTSDKRFLYKSPAGKQPSVTISESWAAWLGAGGGYPAQA
mmetsp:Transcript_17402/g.41247  ORF Transcript_17402/g.41247 Transcript_17402/m.41247 type:complete len:937 (-) Transcript_17402:65-2875(-)